MTTTLPLTATRRYAADDDRWQAVLDRDDAADGRFVTCVRTTGIYCRPSCPARHPKRENVFFAATPAEAERAGYRPCKRCHPNGQSTAQRNARAVADACRTIAEQEMAPSLAELAGSAGMSPYHFHRIFKEVTGLTPKSYAAAHRADRVRAHLANTPSVTRAIYEAGYGSNGRFYATAPETIGMTPTAYREGGVGTRIRFAVGQSSVGSVLVAATERGICAIRFGDDPEALVRDFQDQFAGAELIGNDEAFGRTVAAVIGAIEEPDQRFDLPLDVRGTAFQHRVWQALRTIPAGTTATYTEIAGRIGTPGSARAVAHACATNPVAVAIPCHRVVRQDGDLAGYRWGVERKRALLAREAGN
jgi:AraC family transcriptional regulator of adaptative response/methylated-DNA-[protein]-cysteine methyltransferase